MATNTIPKSYDQLIEQLEDAGDGAATHGAAVGLKQNDEAALRATLEALTGKPAVGNASAVPGHKATWNDAKANKTAKTAAGPKTKIASKGSGLTMLGTAEEEAAAELLGGKTPPPTKAKAEPEEVVDVVEEAGAVVARRRHQVSPRADALDRARGALRELVPGR